MSQPQVSRSLELLAVDLASPAACMEAISSFKQLLSGDADVVVQLKPQPSAEVASLKKQLQGCGMAVGKLLKVLPDWEAAGHITNTAR